MAQDINRSIKLCGEPRLVGATAITVLEYDVDNNIMKASGATVPTDAVAGYAKGCRFVKTDGGIATTLYINEGSATSCDFNAMETSASTVTGVTAGAGLTGGGTEGTVDLAVGAGAGIVVNANDVAIAAGGVKQTQVGYEVVSVTVAAAASTGTATVTSGSIVLGYYPTGNQDQLVDNIAIVTTTLTITLAAAATADNTFKVVLLKA